MNDPTDGNPTLYSETREPHAAICECDHCVADRRAEEVKRWREDGHLLQLQGVELGIENNRLLSAILDELRALRSESNR